MTEPTRVCPTCGERKSLAADFDYRCEISEKFQDCLLCHATGGPTGPGNRVCRGCGEGKHLGWFKWAGENADRNDTCWGCLRRMMERAWAADDGSAPEPKRPEPTEHTCEGCAETKPLEAFPVDWRPRRDQYRLCLECRALVPRCKKYGITVTRFYELYRAQGEACEMCQTPLTVQEARIDHCHSTEVVRGLLCHDCNIGLGWLRDHPERMERGAAYLRRATELTPG